MKPMLELINPYIDTLGFIITAITSGLAFRINWKIQQTIDRSEFHSECAMLIGFYQSVNDQLENNTIDDPDSFKRSIILTNTKIETKYPFISRKIKKSFSEINELNFNKLNDPEINLSLSKNIILVTTLLLKENRQ
jgi:hypothetical protein